MGGGETGDGAEKEPWERVSLPGGRCQGHGGSAHQTGSLSSGGVVEANEGCMGSSGHAACSEPFSDWRGFIFYIKMVSLDFPGGPVVKNPPCSSGDAGSISHQENKILQALE